MKLIFLDFDGVIVTARHSVLVGTWFDPVAIKQLNRIVKETGAKIVISSSWRLNHSVVQIKDYFTREKVKVEVIGVTPQSYTEHRGQEIDEWLTRFKQKYPNEEIKLAIVDDKDAIDFVPHSDKLFQTKFYDGLTEEIADRMIKYLNN